MGWRSNAKIIQIVAPTSFFDLHQKLSFLNFQPLRHKFKIMKQRPSTAFIGASWAALLIGIVTYNIGLWNSGMQLNERGYYFTVLMYSLFSAVSLQKAVRDQMEGVPVTNLYYGISWFSLGLSILFLVIGLWNADLLRSEKGFYGMAFTLSVFAAIAVQKNTRDLKASNGPND